MKIGVLLIAAYGILNVCFNTSELILGFICTIAITLVTIGGIKEESYRRLKAWKKSFWKREA
ncbi:hypothetical protein KPL42_11945 [Clostridium gasigenes]|uniref:hypothetical protein n=1 Tax=Clostridium gasigenes TaxID=94869 RepID=UPI001C0B4A98|nr:hypothetical protein [Clostridium gasigenes]MBU3089199.1 hypothetical protein [Clostridium gasigenes]